MATINFGIAGPMYGDLSAYGYNVRAGANLAVKHINSRGGIHGRMIATKLFDEAMMPRAAEKVVQDGIRYVVGHPCSWGVDTASEVYEKKGVILISPAATSPELARLGRRYFFRTVGTDTAQAAAACDWIVGNIRPGVKIAVLYEATLLHLATSVKQGLEGRGFEVAPFEFLRASFLEASEIVEWLQQNGVGFVYWAGDATMITWLKKAARAARFKARFMGSDDATILGEDSSGPDFLEELLVTSPVNFRHVPNPKHQQLALEMEELAKQNDRDPRPCISPLAFLTYSAVEVLAQAIEAAGDCDDVEEVAQALRSGTFETPVGSISFDEHGDLKTSEKTSEFIVEECHAGRPKTRA